MEARRGAAASTTQPRRDIGSSSPLSGLLSLQAVIILDGGMGTHLQSLGVPLDPKLW